MSFWRRFFKKKPTKPPSPEKPTIFSGENILLFPTPEERAWRKYPDAVRYEAAVMAQQISDLVFKALGLEKKK